MAVIYKITNVTNNECYIGQTIDNPPENRWKRHQNDALKNKLDTHFARALRSYGVENFKFEIIEEFPIDISAKELTKREQYWIRYYDSLNNGYNETDAAEKCGGNTYQSKTPEELAIIGEKIRQTKLGGLNPHSTKVKCLNVQTGEEKHFDSQAEMQEFFGATNHQFISRRCRGEIQSLYQGKWNIAYEDDDYDVRHTPAKNNARAKAVKVKNLETDEEKTFKSYAEAERYFNQKPRAFSSKAFNRGNEFIYNNKFYITKLYE